ncbi:MAG: DMT family transporter [Flavobacteriales bacterium]
MMTNERKGNLLLLHVIVFIWGFTGILGREITLSSIPLVWWRVFIAAASIGVFALIFRKNIRVNRSDLMKFGGVGLLTAAHWICFFSSIKVSNVSVALAVISTTSFFVALVAPFIRREKFQSYELILGILVIAGLFIIFKFEMKYASGILLSLLASLFAAIFSSFNSNFIQKHSSAKIAFWEMAFALVGVSIYMLFDLSLFESVTAINFHDLRLVLILGVVCTGFAFIAGIEVMKVLSPFTCAIAINLEPIYTIALALWLYGDSEYMSPAFYIGTVIILSTLFLEAWLKKRQIRN